jgi:hypothetical protein
VNQAILACGHGDLRESDNKRNAAIVGSPLLRENEGFIASLSGKRLCDAGRHRQGLTEGARAKTGRWRTIRSHHEPGAQYTRRWLLLNLCSVATRVSIYAQVL